MTKSQGKITTWNDQKGFGFISPMAGGERTFVHIKAFAASDRRPAVGDLVSYTLSRDANGRSRATKARIAGTKSGSNLHSSGIPISSLAAFSFLLLLGACALASVLPLAISVVYCLASLITFGAYAIDKAAARRGRWRTPENTLHLLALIGGWPGGLLAQSRLRHKTRKQPFRAIFWMTVLLNCSALIWLLTPEGSAAWNTVMGEFTDFSFAAAFR